MIQSLHCRHPIGSEHAYKRAYVMLGHLGLARRFPMLGQAATSILYSKCLLSRASEAGAPILDDRAFQFRARVCARMSHHPWPPARWHPVLSVICLQAVREALVLNASYSRHMINGYKSSDMLIGKSMLGEIVLVFLFPMLGEIVLVFLFPMLG